MTDDSYYKADLKQKEGSPAGEPSYYFHIQDVHYFKPASSTAERMM